jgi:HK97 family phage major capsid protein
MVQGRRLNDLYGIPVYNQENMQSTLATGTKVMVVGDFSYYALVDGAGDGGLRITRNPYLYEASGQVGIFARFRQSGAVLQAEAFQYGTMA